MARLLTAHAEVRDSLHQALAEEFAPDLIHRHTRSQRMIFAHQPACEIESGSLALGLQGGQHSKCCGQHWISGLEEVSAMQ